MNEQKLLSAPIPWYRTRLFWGVVIGALIAWGIGFYMLGILQTGDSFSVMARDLSIILGVLPLFTFLGKSFHNATPLYLIYYLVMISLLYFTFHKKRVEILFPLVFLIIFLSGHVTGTLFLAFFD
ncbi:MAG TPA: hypothetical protein VGA06_00390 [Candidatus Paceibacterota bacterium]|jgi:hypothetical protein